jgi:uncharacterized membrane protein SpoIIM required for sporulation
MKQEAFQAQHEPEWTAFGLWLDQRQRPAAKVRARDAEGAFADADFPLAYRRLCQQLALAEGRGYSAQLVRRLRDLVDRGHLVFYRPRAPRWRRVLDFFASDFPRLVRSEKRAMIAAALLLYVPFFGVMLLLHFRPELAYSIFEPGQLANFEKMYDPHADRLGRESGTNLEMFGFYILNNVSIGFRTFASGLLAGVGAVFMMVFNGVFFGGVAGHLNEIGYGDPFWRFVAGHSGPELTAIVIAGGAGLQIGMALIAPGRRSRARALIDAGRVGAKLVLGVATMLVFAAFIEAYWSSIAWMPREVKFSVGALIWLGIGLWLWRGGRGRAPLAEEEP